VLATQWTATTFTRNSTVFFKVWLNSYTNPRVDISYRWAAILLCYVALHVPCSTAPSASVRTTQWTHSESKSAQHSTSGSLALVTKELINKLPEILCPTVTKHEFFSKDFSKKLLIKEFTKICPAGTEVFRADGCRGTIEAIIAFRNFSTATWYFFATSA